MGHPLQAAPSRGAATTWSWAAAAVGFIVTCFFFLDLTTAERVGERILNLSQGNNSKEEKHYRQKVSVGMVVVLISKTPKSSNANNHHLPCTCPSTPPGRHSAQVCTMSKRQSWAFSLSSFNSPLQLNSLRLVSQLALYKLGELSISSIDYWLTVRRALYHTCYVCSSIKSSPNPVRRMLF